MTTDDSSSSTTSIEDSLKGLFPQSTSAERSRFVQHARCECRGGGGGKGDGDGDDSGGRTMLGLFHHHSDNVNKEEDDGHPRHAIIQDKAGMLLKEYLEWRHRYGLDEDDQVPSKDADDSDIWKWAVSKASNGTLTPVEQVAFRLWDKTGNPIVDRKGRLILQILGARMDPHTVPSHIYASAFALYVDRCFDRESDETGCLMIDVRPGTGWTNPLFPLVVDSLGVIIDTLANKIHPGRCAFMVFYPLPLVVELPVRGVIRLLPTELQDEVAIVEGYAGLHSPIPMKAMEEYADETALVEMEANRVALFVTK